MKENQIAWCGMVIGAVFGISVLLFTGCDQVEKVPVDRNVERPVSRENDSDYLQTLERGVMNGFSYSILLHKPSGKKIFAYSNHGMVFIPEPNAENAETNHIK